MAVLPKHSTKLIIVVKRHKRSRARCHKSWQNVFVRVGWSKMSVAFFCCLLLWRSPWTLLISFSPKVLPVASTSSKTIKIDFESTSRPCEYWDSCTKGRASSSVVFHGLISNSQHVKEKAKGNKRERLGFYQWLIQEIIDIGGEFFMSLTHKLLSKLKSAHVRGCYNVNEITSTHTSISSSSHRRWTQTL